MCGRSGQAYYLAESCAPGDPAGPQPRQITVARSPGVNPKGHEDERWHRSRWNEDPRGHRRRRPPGGRPACWPTPATGGPEAVAKEMAETLREAAADGGLPAAFDGVGVGAPGVVDAEAGTVAHSPNIAGWDAPFPLAKALEDDLGTTVVLGNDVGVAVAGEAKLGAGRPYRSFLGLWWGTGIGGGLSCSTASTGSAAAPRASWGTWSSASVAARRIAPAPRHRRGVRGAAGDGAARPQAPRLGHEDQALRDHGETGLRVAQQQRLGARARAGGQARARADRRSGRGDRRRCRLGGDAPRHRGDRRRRRPRQPARRALRRADRGGDPPAALLARAAARGLWSPSSATMRVRSARRCSSTPGPGSPGRGCEAPVGPSTSGSGPTGRAGPTGSAGART